MKKVIRLTESDLNRIIKRVINEDDDMEERKRRNNKEVYEMKRRELDRAIYSMAELSRNGDSEGVERLAHILVKRMLPEIDSYVNF